AGGQLDGDDAAGGRHQLRAAALDDGVGDAGAAGHPRRAVSQGMLWRSGKMGSGAGGEVVNRQLDLLAVAFELGGEELEEAGKTIQGALEGDGREADPRGPFAALAAGTQPKVTGAYRTDTDTFPTPDAAAWGALVK